MVYACDNCHFLFSRTNEPEQCPDCGKYTVQPATQAEQREYQTRLNGPLEPQEPGNDGQPIHGIIYDNDAFFQKYSQMERSRKGLSRAGEWHELQKLLPDFRGKSVLDLGCGYGWHCKYASEQGAAQVLGVDLSHKMLETAKARNAGENIEYCCGNIEELDFLDGSFDIILSSLVFHYVQDFPGLVQNISRWLKLNGSFVFSVEHPIFTAYGSQDWFYNEHGEILHFPVDNYYIEGQRDAVFLGEHMTKYHRTLTTYLSTLLQSGFLLQAVVEPQPPEEMMELPGMRDELRRPMMLLVSAEKQ